MCSTVALILGTIGTVMLLVPACHHTRVWHSGRKELGGDGLDSWWIIGASAVVAIIAISAMFFGLGLRAATKPQAKASAPATMVSHLKEPHIYSGSISPPANPRFEAKFTRNGQRCRLFIEDRYYPGGIMGPAGWIPRPPVEIAP